jgi:hypothetical protein
MFLEWSQVRILFLHSVNASDLPKKNITEMFSVLSAADNLPVHLVGDLSSPRHSSYSTKETNMARNYPSMLYDS